ncbi:NADH-ubiquinone oxidoreductase chain 1 [Capsicum baccatum]|uniref:NADH-ubiquinone oxidoreductase chain 1 n=1 Tax=Capsicum baccatum TaxID=33114 RepID=A0A2G2V6H1_CAPBA|nr:NADH-ubiquinone oxidoreductase chain 1 [Capsicum baccatum]
MDKLKGVREARTMPTGQAESGHHLGWEWISPYASFDESTPVASDDWQRLGKHGRATCRETCTCGFGRGPRYTVLIYVGSHNSSEIVMAQKQIWSGIPLFLVLVMFFISRLEETNRASFDLPKAEAESVAGYNVEYARDAILNSSLLVKANVPGSRGLILTEIRGGSLPTSKYSILGKRHRESVKTPPFSKKGLRHKAPPPNLRNRVQHWEAYFSGCSVLEYAFRR